MYKSKSHHVLPPSLMSYPSNITHVGDGAFQNCYRLPSLYLPNLRYIGSNAFENCWAFTSFSIPGNVTSVGEAAFKGCHNLDTVYIQGCDNLPLGKNAFAECESLKAIICTSLIPPVVDQDLGLTPEQKATVKVIVPKMASGSLPSGTLLERHGRLDDEDL